MCLSRGGDSNLAHASPSGSVLALCRTHIDAYRQCRVWGQYK